MSERQGSAGTLLFEKTLQAEVLKVEADMIKCEIRNSFELIDKGCPDCDVSKEKDFFGHEDEKYKGKYLQPVARKVAVVDENGNPVGGLTTTVYTDGKQACYEDHNCLDVNDSAVKSMIVYVAKPFSLRTSPFDNKTIKINEGQSDEYTITYKYDQNGRKRTLTYSKETERCSRGIHTEVIWPAYRERVGEADADGKLSDDYVPGDMILYIENTMSPDVSNSNFKAASLSEEEKKRLKNPENPGSEALYTLDANIDGRKWSDDCGKGGGGGGGGVWV